MLFRRVLPVLALASVLAVIAPAQGGLGRGRGGGGGGGSRPSQRPSGPSNAPRRSEPSRTGPSRSAPPSRVEPSNGGSRPSNPAPARQPAPSATYPNGTTGPVYGGVQAGQRPERVGGLGRQGGMSRSGRVQYGTVNNAVQIGGPIRIGNAPLIGNVTTLGNRVYRSDRVGIVNGYRVGYTHYNRNWRDDFFYYPYYSFSPFGGNCFASPFYSYAFVPAYIGLNRVTVINGYQSPWFWQNGSTYNWNAGYQNGNYYNNDRRSDRNVRDAVDDLADGFQRAEPRLLSRLVGRRGQVAILRDGRYDYSVDVDAFDDLLRDLAINSQTQSYRVEDSRVFNDSVRLVARHDYIDPWNQRQTMYHHILLAPDRGEYVIREFGTSPVRYW